MHHARTRGFAALSLLIGAIFTVVVSVAMSTNALAASTYIVRSTDFVLNPADPGYAKLRSVSTTFIKATTGKNPPGTLNVIDYPAALRPISRGLIFDPRFDDSVNIGLAALPGASKGDVFIGMSQGTAVLTKYKRGFNQQFSSNPAAAPAITFILVGDVERPNGGIGQRFAGKRVPYVGWTFDGPAPTTTAGAPAGTTTTYDINGEYDGFADFPNYPTNPFATLNAVFGMVLVHGKAPDAAVLNDPTKTTVTTYGDTKYYTVHTDVLPLLQPWALLGVPPKIIAALDGPLRVLVDAGYDRSINPGIPTRAQLFGGLLPLVAAVPDFFHAVAQSVKLVATVAPSASINLPLVADNSGDLARRSARPVSADPKDTDLPDLDKTATPDTVDPKDTDLPDLPDLDKTATPDTVDPKNTDLPDLDTTVNPSPAGRDSDPVDNREQAQAGVDDTGTAGAATGQDDDRKSTANS